MNEYMDKLSAWTIASEAMMTNTILPLCTMLACTVSVLGCIAPEGSNDETESLATTQEAALISNALISNALISNALISNALISNALISTRSRPMH